ncbi:unnamed protein product, partial [Vitis vinifera]
MFIGWYLRTHDLVVECSAGHPLSHKILEQYSWYKQRNIVSLKDQKSADAQQLVDTYHFPKETEKAKISSKVRDSGEPFLGLHFRNFKTVIKSPPTFPRRSIYSLSHGCTHSRPHSLHSLVCDGIIVGETQRDGNLRCGGCELDDDLLGGHSGDQGVRIGHRPELQRRVCSGDVHRRGGSHLDWDAGVGRVSEGHQPPNLRP